jgi:hypothetical protein
MIVGIFNSIQECKDYVKNPSSCYSYTCNCGETCQTNQGCDENQVCPDWTNPDCRINAKSKCSSCGPGALTWDEIACPTITPTPPVTVCYGVEVKNLCNPGYGSWDMTNPYKIFTSLKDCNDYVNNPSSCFPYSCNCDAQCLDGRNKHNSSQKCDPNVTPTPRPENVSGGKPICNSCGKDNLRCRQTTCQVVTTSSFAPATADINNDEVVNSADYSLCLANYLYTGENLPCDTNDDQVVNSLDAALVISNFGKKVE